MGKKIKFPLQMKDGYKVRTIEELQKHADEESIVGYFFNGKLKNWLKDRYYEDEIKEIEKLDKSDSKLVEIIYNILKINKAVKNFNSKQVQKVIKSQEKISKIKEYTDNEEILKNIDYVATSQKEFELMINDKQDKIYLLGSKFILTHTIRNKKLIGINNPLIKLNEEVNLNNQNIKLENCKLDYDYKLRDKQNVISKERKIIYIQLVEIIGNVAIQRQRECEKEYKTSE